MPTLSLPLASPPQVLVEQSLQPVAQLALLAEHRLKRSLPTPHRRGPHTPEALSAELHGVLLHRLG